MSFFTEKFGAFSSLIRIPRSNRHGVRSSSLQLLSCVEMELNYRETSEMQAVRNVSPVYSWKTIPYQPVKSFVAMFLAEFLHNAIRSEGVNTQLFGFIEQSLTWFDEAETGIGAFHLVFLLKMTLFLGIRPNMEGYRKGMYFDMLSGKCIDLPPLHKYVIHRDDTVLLSFLMEVDYEGMHELGMTKMQRWHILEIITTYYRLHVPGFLPLQSVDVLREVFS